VESLFLILRVFEQIFSQGKLVDMVRCMKSHQGRFHKKSFSRVLCAFSRVFSRFAEKKVLLDGYLFIFTVVWPLVGLLDPPFFTGSSKKKLVLNYNRLRELACCRHGRLSYPPK
jgi:hypothetical protein